MEALRVPVSLSLPVHLILVALEVSLPLWGFLCVWQRAYTPSLLELHSSLPSAPTNPDSNPSGHTCPGSSTSCSHFLGQIPHPSGFLEANSKKSQPDIIGFCSRNWIKIMSDVLTPFLRRLEKGAGNQPGANWSLPEQNPTEESVAGISAEFNAPTSYNLGHNATAWTTLLIVLVTVCFHHHDKH